MQNLTFSDYIVFGIILMFLLGRIFTMLGWKKGVYIADELQKALQQGRDLILSARNVPGGEPQKIDQAAQTAAASIRGLNVADVRPIIENLVGQAQDKRNGVSVTLDSDGNIKVDPTGAVTKVAHKVGKWFKKVV